MIEESDPLRILTLPEVARRTGYTPRTIRRFLTLDRADKRPNRNFPAPLKTPRQKLEWRESWLMTWLDEHQPKAKATAQDKESK